MAPGRGRIDHTEPASTGAIIAILAFIVVAAAVVVAVHVRNAATDKPVACATLPRPLGQLANDLAADLKGVSSGAQSPSSVMSDTQTISSLVIANPGSFAHHVGPVVSAMQQLVADGQSKGGASAADAVQVSTAVEQAAAFCGFTPARLPHGP